jgi:hypothetical protein
VTPRHGVGYQLPPTAGSPGAWALTPHPLRANRDQHEVGHGHWQSALSIRRSDRHDGLVFTRRESGTIKIRASIGFRLAYLAAVIVVLFIYSLSPVDGARWFFYYWLALGPIIFVMNSWFGLDLTATEAKVNSFRRRRVPWSAVQAVTQEPFMGGRRVVLWTVAGERVPLRAPIVDFTGIGGGAFEDRFHVIGRWWLAHRGSAWAPSYDTAKECDAAGSSR